MEHHPWTSAGSNRNALVHKFGHLVSLLWARLILSRFRDVVSHLPFEAATNAAEVPKFPTTKTHFALSAPAAQLIAAEMSQAHEQRTPFFYLKGLGRFFIFISTSLPCGAQKKKKKN